MHYPSCVNIKHAVQGLLQRKDAELEARANLLYKAKARACTIICTCTLRKCDLPPASCSAVLCQPAGMHALAV